MVSGGELFCPIDAAIKRDGGTESSNAVLAGLRSDPLAALLPPVGRTWSSSHPEGAERPGNSSNALLQDGGVKYLDSSGLDERRVRPVTFGVLDEPAVSAVMLVCGVRPAIETGVVSIVAPHVGQGSAVDERVFGQVERYILGIAERLSIESCGILGMNSEAEYLGRICSQTRCGDYSFLDQIVTNNVPFYPGRLESYTDDDARAFLRRLALFSVADSTIKLLEQLGQTVNINCDPVFRERDANNVSFTSIEPSQGLGPHNVTLLALRRLLATPHELLLISEDGTRLLGAGIDAMQQADNESESATLIASLEGALPGLLDSQAQLHQSFSGLASCHPAMGPRAEAFSEGCMLRVLRSDRRHSPLPTRDSEYSCVIYSLVSLESLGSEKRSYLHAATGVEEFPTRVLHIISPNSSAGFQLDAVVFQPDARWPQSLLKYGEEQFTSFAIPDSWEESARVPSPSRGLIFNRTIEQDLHGSLIDYLRNDLGRIMFDPAECNSIYFSSFTVLDPREPGNRRVIQQLWEKALRNPDWDHSYLRVLGLTSDQAILVRANLVINDHEVEALVVCVHDPMSGILRILNCTAAPSKAGES